MKGYQKKPQHIWLALFGIVLGLGALLKTVSAGEFSQAYIRLNRMAATTANSGILVVFTVPAGNSATEAKVVVEFSAGFTVAASPTITVTGIPAGATALPGTLVAAGSTTTLTVTGVTNLTAATQYAFILSDGVTNPSAGAHTATITTKTGADAAIDSKIVGLRVISDDQVTVSATVDPTFNWVLSGNSMALGTLSSSSVVSVASPITVTATTNGTNGWIGWVKSQNTGLTSASASNTIATSGTVDGAPTTLSTGAEGYVLDADLTTDSGTGDGTVTIAAEYNGGTTSAGGTLASTLTQFASSDGTTGGDVITLIPRATISTVTEAATDYTDTLDVIGAGNF